MCAPLADFDQRENGRNAVVWSSRAPGRSAAFAQRVTYEALNKEVVGW